MSWRAQSRSKSEFDQVQVPQCPKNLNWVIVPSSHTKAGRQKPKGQPAQVVGFQVEKFELSAEGTQI
jgi:hypothetical protein